MSHVNPGPYTLFKNLCAPNDVTFGKMTMGLEKIPSLPYISSGTWENYDPGPHSYFPRPKFAIPTPDDINFFNMWKIFCEHLGPYLQFENLRNSLPPPPDDVIFGKMSVGHRKIPTSSFI